MVSPSVGPRGRGGQRVTYIITEPCIGTKDKACLEACPVDCIYDKDEWEQLFIHPEECIDCGACVEACPVEAIFEDVEVPDKWQGWIAKNYVAFGVEPDD